MRPPPPTEKPERRKLPELLAPAGDSESLTAALRSGADAVYFGLADGFNARARATNFSLETLPDTTARIHRAGVRAFLTLNTLVFEAELEKVEEIIRAAAQCGIDALIVQDPAVAIIARRVAPKLELHGSTQMTISSPEGAEFAERLGITRVVLPRELSVAEIKRFAAATTIETEVFVHGALCVSWSGQCLTSEAWGGRSANRGQCAQSCRMPYDLVLDGVVRDLGDAKYILSPKDLAGIHAVPELIEAGVHGLKIEGRQKGPVYVATAVASYRKILDDGVPTAPAADDHFGELADMSLAYSRGFSHGFLAGSDHQTLVEGRFPKHRGIFVGRVKKVDRRRVLVADDRRFGRPWTGALFADEEKSRPEGDVASPLATLGEKTSEKSTFDLRVDIRPGMGIVFDSGRPEDKNEPGGPLFFLDRDHEGMWLGFGEPGPELHRVRPGDRVWATSDPRLARRVEKLLGDKDPEGRIRVDLCVGGEVGQPLCVTARAENHRATVCSTGALATARSGGLDHAILSEKLGAFGGTPFSLGVLDHSDLLPGLFIAVSELKEIRRKIVADLTRSVEKGPACPVTQKGVVERLRIEKSVQGTPATDLEPTLVPLVRSDAQLEAAIECGVREVELDWMEMVGLGRAVARAKAAGLKTTVATLRVQKPGEESFDRRIASLAPDAVLARHWGAVMHFSKSRAKDSPIVHGDFSLNVTNSITAHDLLDLGLTTLTASYDLDESQLFRLLDHFPAHRMAVVIHHRISTFHTEHCLYSHLLSAGRDFNSCGRPCERHEISVQDHNGKRHPVIVDAGCRNTVFNGDVQSSALLLPELLRRGVRRFRLEFTRESRDEVRAALTAYGELLRGTTPAQAVLDRLGVTARHGVSASPMALIV